MGDEYGNGRGVSNGCFLYPQGDGDGYGDGRGNSFAADTMHVAGRQILPRDIDAEGYSVLETHGAGVLEDV